MVDLLNYMVSANMASVSFFGFKWDLLTVVLMALQHCSLFTLYILQ